MLLRKHQHLIMQYLHYSSPDLEKLLLLLMVLNFHPAFCKDGNQRGMIVQDFKRSIDAGKLNERHFAGKKGLFGGDYFELHINWFLVPGSWFLVLILTADC